MSIIIKDMDMPNSCQECPFNSDNAWCLVPGNWRERYYIPENGRSEFCPLQYSEDNNDDREFVEILINNTPNKDKPYYEIHYIENGEHHIGYSSYNIKIVSEYIRDFFIGKRNVLELPDEKHTNFAKVVEQNHNSGKEMEEKQMSASELWLDSSIKQAYEKYNVLYSTSK